MPVCNTCKAKSETIAALHMVIQAQNQSLQLLAERTSKPLVDADDPVLKALEAMGPISHPHPEDNPLPRLWANEEEEDVMDAWKAGEIEPEEAEKRLAAIQAAQPPFVPVVIR